MPPRRFGPDDRRGAVAVVTGGASGIGFALARRLAAGGAAVVLADIEAAALDVAVDQLQAAEPGATVLGVPTDVADAASVDALAAATIAELGRVDVVCNNAGIIVSGPVWEVPREDWTRILDINLGGVINGIRSFVPRLLEQGTPAWIVNTSSMAGIVSLPGIGPYVTAKQGVVGLSEVLHHDLLAAGAPIGVSVLCPGYVPTRLGAADRLGEVAPPADGEPSADDVAGAVLDAMDVGRFYVFSHPRSARHAERRAAAIAADGPPYALGLPTP